jgi:uncharacterized protein
MPWTQVVILAALLLAGYRVWVFHKQGRSTAMALGLSVNRRQWLYLAAGTAISTVAMSLIFLYEWSSGHLRIVQINPLKALTDDWITFIMVPLTEEFAFRCAILGGLLVLIPRTSIAVVLSACIFGGLHAMNPNAGVLSVLVTSIAGLAYGVAFLISERIWFPLGLHFGWNYFEARVFGFMLSGGFQGPAPLILQHDSGPALVTGGLYGPEGGLVGLAAKLFVYLCVTAWFIIERRRKEKPAIAGCA